LGATAVPLESNQNVNLILRSELERIHMRVSERLEGWATGAVRVPTLRDAALQAAPQGEVSA
jgi:hypothetical protein